MHQMQWCEAHRHCTLRVMEKRLNAVTNPEQGGLRMAPAQENRRLRPCVKTGGGHMVWGLSFRFWAISCSQILSLGMTPSCPNLTIMPIKTWLVDFGLEELAWPAQSSSQPTLVSVLKNLKKDQNSHIHTPELCGNPLWGWGMILNLMDWSL